MALKDCIAKLRLAGHEVSQEDIDLLLSPEFAELSEAEAVRKLLLRAYQNVVDIADRARKLGAKVAKNPGLLAEVRSIQKANLDALNAARLELLAEDSEIDLRLGEIEMVQATVVRGAGRFIDTSDRADLVRRLSGLLFTAKGLRGRGVMGLQGKTPLELLDSWDDLLVEQSALLDQRAGIVLKQEALDARLEVIVSGVKDKNRVLDVLGDYIVRRPGEFEQRDIGEDQGNLFADPSLTPEQHELEASINYQAIAKLEEVGTMETGITNVQSPAEAAHVLAPIRKNAQEGIWAVVTDAQGEVLSVVEHTKGGIADSSMFPAQFFGHILQVEGASRVWMAHNHPSGKLTWSKADDIITQRMITLMRGSNVQLEGHVLVAPGEKQFREMDRSGTDLGLRDIPPVPRRKKVSISTRKIRRRALVGPTLNNPSIAKTYVSQNLPADAEGFLVLDNRTQVRAFVSFPVINMAQLRGTGMLDRVIRMMADLNTNSMMVVAPTFNQKIANNIQGLAGAADMRMLDWLWQDDVSGDIVSASSTGGFTGRTFFQSDLVPDDLKGLDRIEEIDVIYSGLPGQDVAGAVIPMDADPDLRAYLNERGIPYKEYETGKGVEVIKSRADAVAEFTQQLVDKGGVVEQSEIGFTSGLLNAARTMPQEKGTGAQMFATLKKQPGVKKEELEWLDLEAFVTAQPRITRENIIAYIQLNGVRVEEIQLGQVSPDFSLAMTWNTIDFGEEAYTTYGMIPDMDQYIWRVTNPNTTDGFTVIDDRASGNIGVLVEETGEWLDIAEYSPPASQDLTDAGDAIDKYMEDKYRGAFAGPAEFNTKTLPGGDQNYREVLLTMPTTAEASTRYSGEIVARGFTNDLTRDPEQIRAEVIDNMLEDLIRAGLAAEDYVGLREEGIIEFRGLDQAKYDRMNVMVAQSPADIQGVTTIDGPIPDPAALPAGSVFPTFTSGHYGGTYANTIGWFRMNDRVGPKGERILFIEELQSDWHQKGRKHGYMSTKAEISEQTKRWRELQQELIPLRKAIDPVIRKFIAIMDVELTSENLIALVAELQLGPAWHEVWTRRAKAAGRTLDLTAAQISAVDTWRDKLLQERSAHREHMERRQGGLKPPDAPFKGNVWAELALKRVIRMAAEEGYDQVAWTTGEQQADRYSLRKEVSALHYRVDLGSLMAVSLDGKILFDRKGIEPDDLHKWVGGPLAERILKTWSDRVEAGDPVPDSEPIRVDGPELDMGGEGMLSFYDKTMVNLMNRVVRKLDPSVSVAKFGGELVVDADVSPEMRRAHNIIDETFQVHQVPISPTMRERAKRGQTLFQEKRGRITFDAQRRAIIRLGKAHNLSTFLHESGHLYLEILGDLAEMKDAPQQTIGDWAKILKHLGVNHRREINTGHHELFARSFEAYLREGKAPDPELQEVFSAYRMWLTRVYKHLRDLLRPGEELNDEIRGVFDRLVATDEAIAAAAVQEEFVAIFATADEMGVSQEAFDVYRGNMEAAHRDAVDRESAKMLKAMHRESEVWWKVERAKLEEEVREEIYAMRVYKALSFLQRGTQPDGSAPTRAIYKLSKKSLIDKYGKEFIKRLPKPWVYSAKGGVDVDVAAEQFGYESGDEMIQEMLRAAKMESLIQAETDARMRKQYPDPLIDGTLASDAVTAVYNEKRSEILHAELRRLRKKMREDRKIVAATQQAAARQRRQERIANEGQIPRRGELALIKEAARRQIDAMEIRNIKPHRYRMSAQKAGNKAFKAAAKGDFQTAYSEKLKQIRSAELFRASTRAKEEADKTAKYLKKFDSRRVQAKLGKSGMLHRILQVLEGMNFRNISLAEVDRERAMGEMLEAIKDGRLVAPPNVVARLRDTGTNWQDLTAEEFRGMRDVVRQLEHQARTQAEAVVNGEKVLVDMAVDAVVDSIVSTGEQVDFQRGRPTSGQAFKKGLKEGVHHALSVGTIARLLDAADWGAVTRWIVVPIRRAYVEKLLPRFQKYQEDVAAIYVKHYSNSEMAKLGQKEITVEEMGREELSKSDILAMAQHWGSESNRKALLGGILEDAEGNPIGPAYPEQGVQAALAHLDKRDWLFVQDMWDYVNSYWPEISEAEQRRRGIVPAKIEAMPFTVQTSDGETVNLRGGYMRLYYQPGPRYTQPTIDDMALMSAHGFYVSANTRSGSTFERVQNHGRVVQLDLGSVDRHLREVIRDLSIGDEVRFVKKILDSNKTRAALRKTGNEAALQELNLWLVDSAVGELAAQSVWEKLAGWTRVGFTKSKLAFSATVTLLQLTGVFQSMTLVGKKAYTMGFGEFLKNPMKQYEYVMKTSKFMTTRYGILQTFSVEVSDSQAFMRSMFGPVPTRFKRGFDNVAHYYFWTIAKMQSLVDVTTWLGAKWRGLNVEGLSEAEAILFADTMVEGAQTSGIFADRSGLERGTLGSRTRQSQYVRLWTTLIAYMLRKQGLAYEATAKFNRKRSLKGAANLLVDYMFLFTFEGIASFLIYGIWPGDDDEEADAATTAAWVARATLDSVIAGIPLVREVASARYGSGNTPIGSLAKDSFDLLVQAGQGELDKQFVTTAIKAFGTAAHLPSSQVNRAISAYLEDDPEWYEYVLGPRD